MGAFSPQFVPFQKKKILFIVHIIIMLSMKVLNYGTRFKLYIVHCLLFTCGILVIYFIISSISIITIIIIIIIIIIIYIFFFYTYVTLLGAISLTLCVFGGIHISDLTLSFYLFLL